uniref:TIR domain-containing protein n=1 Tax=Timema cristinae TaxID=61476 RepID=A0A7R9GTW1_TIMCR|nr:unnamed protein product [Timema cristinae]
MSLKCRWQLYGFSILSFLSLLATEPSDSPQSALGLFHGYTTALGVRGTLKPPDVVTDEVKQILEGVNIPTSCPLEVDELNSACVECQDPNYIYCNITESLITEDLDGLDQINFLRIDTESLHQIKSRFFGELDVKTLDIRYTGLLSLDFDLFSGIQNLRSLIIRSPSTVVIQRTQHTLSKKKTSFRHHARAGTARATVLSLPGSTTFLPTPSYVRMRTTVKHHVAGTEILEPLQSTLTFLDASGSTFEDNSHPTQEQPLPNILEKLMIGLQSKENNSTSIQGLSFANSQLTSIPYKALYIVRGSLQYLSLSRNNIDTLSMRDNMSNLNGEANQTININDANETQLMFPFMPKLLELDLSDCALYALNATILSFMDDERSTTTKDRVFKYDIFVSYSDCNREWVLDELLPNLENDSNLKVCLHERDFQFFILYLWWASGQDRLSHFVSHRDNQTIVGSSPFLSSATYSYLIDLKDSLETTLTPERKAHSHLWQVQLLTWCLSTMLSPSPRKSPAADLEALVEQLYLTEED